MCRTLKFYIAFVTCMLIAAVSNGQNNKSVKGKGKPATDTSAAAPKTKTARMIADADSYTQMTADVKTKLKSLFPVKAGDTMYFVIPNITYNNPNLKIFKQKLAAVKNTRDLTSGYKNNTAVVKILFKGGDASTLYDNLDDGLKDMFIPEDIEGNRAILDYKPDAATESKGTSKPMTVTKVN